MDSTSFAPRALAELRTLGSVELQVGGIPRLERRRKSLAVLAFLARQAPTRFRRAELATLFWPSSPEERARQSLRQALAELRNALGDAVGSTTEHAWIESSRLAVDATRFEQDVDAGRLAEARAHAAGVFMEGYEGVAGAPFDLWLASERERLEARRAWLAAHAEELPSHDRDASGPPPAPPMTTGRSRRTTAPSAPLRSSVPLAVSMDQSAALHVLSSAWNRACQGGAEAVLVEGEAGLGKSYIVERFVRTARSEQPQSVVLVARALESERQVPGSLVHQLLAQAPAGTESDVDATDDSGRLRAAAARIAGVVPLLVVVDDATLADDAGQVALGALVQAPPKGALVVLATRPFMLSDVRFRGALQRNPALGRVRLTPMRADAVATVVRGLLPLEESRLASLAARLCDEYRGNPGLVEATIAAMVDDGYLVHEADGTWRLGRALPARLPIAADVRERTRRVMPRLSADARQVLEAAAVPGDAVDLSLLSTAVELEAAVVDAALHELMTRRLLRASVRGDRWLEFTSAAVRHAVLDQMGLPRRRALQRVHERALRHGQGARVRDRISYAAPARDRSAITLLRNTFAAAAGLLN